MRRQRLLGFRRTFPLVELATARPEFSGVGRRQANIRGRSTSLVVTIDAAADAGSLLKDRRQLIERVADR
jgi:hypothetical protein